MAQDDTTLLTEVRLLTDYDEGIMSNADLLALIGLAKAELQAGTGSAAIDFYAVTEAERALFWLTCIFAKVKTGEIDSMSFSIGELKARQPNVTERYGVWFDNFWKHYRTMEGGAPVAHVKSNRPDRTYRFDN